MSESSCNPMRHFCILLITLVTSSHPIYLSYFIFFSPYLLNLFSFLSPLFLTTLFTFLTLLEPLNDPQEYVISHFDHIEIYHIFFGKVDNEHQDSPEENDHQDSVHNVEQEKNKEKRLENFLQILDQFEKMSASNVEKKTKPENKVILVERQTIITESVVKDGSNATMDQQISSSKMRSSSHSSQSSSFSSVGSMRKEKEWNRTLACKLFEERHHDGGAQGMDSLWETYESVDTTSSDVKTKTKKMKTKTKKIEQVEEEEEILTGQLCCLQALKMSTGKMNLGMKKPSLVKFSKAIKGFAWFTKHSKKVHNNSSHGDITSYYKA